MQSLSTLFAHCHPTPQLATFQSGVEYLDSLWANGPSRLLFVRIDLGIDFTHQTGVNFTQVVGHFENLKNNRRSKPSIFKHYVGCIWSLEWKEDKSYHYHCLFIFNGHEVEDGVYYSNEIGYYWRNHITGGIGTFWNCNNEEDNYPQSGIGMIDYRDMQKRYYLLTRVLSYLTKPDMHIRQAIHQDALALGFPDWARHVRTFGTSNKLRPRMSNVGRPRAMQQLQPLC